MDNLEIFDKYGNVLHITDAINCLLDKGKDFNTSMDVYEVFSIGNIEGKLYLIGSFHVMHEGWVNDKLCSLDALLNGL